MLNFEVITGGKGEKYADTVEASLKSELLICME